MPPRALSVILPARNEAAHITAALHSLAALEYPGLEVVVVDDGSTDGTYRLAEQFIAAYRGSKTFVLLQGPGEPPQGWVGKTYAADYAIKQSTGNTLLICDVDIEHSPSSLSGTLECFGQEKASLLSRIPQMRVGSLGEYPVPYWTFVLWLSSRMASLLLVRQSFAMGSYLMFTRGFYERSGGWQKHRSFPESLPLLNYCLKHGERFVLMQSRGEIRTRMYAGGRATFRGIVRNVNFGLLQPAPLLISFLLFAGLGTAVGAALRAEAWSLAVVAAFMAVYAAYLLYNRYGALTVLGGLLTLPFMPFYFLAVAVCGLARRFFPIATTWRGRSMRVQ